ncbi:MAG: NADH-quinone oxidoreductase subunit C [Acidimicrobiales bacterium]
MSSVDQPPIDAPAEEAPAEAEPAAPPPDDPYQSVLEGLGAELGDSLLESHPMRGDLWVRVRPDAWKRVAEVCRRQLGFDYFCYLSGIDWMPHTWPNPKVVEEGENGEAAEAEAEPEPEAAAQDADNGWQTGVAGGETRFQVLARLYSTTRHLGVTFKADLDDTAPSVATWSDVYPGADWHERETWEMYGFDFVGHPNLIHLYLPSAFEGFPLRKDFPLLSREVKPWPGLVDVEQFPPGAGEDPSDDPAAMPEEDAG